MEDAIVRHSGGFDFFLTSSLKRDAIGESSRALHYRCLLRESNFDAEDLQLLTYWLCYMRFTSTEIVSRPAPLHHAQHIAKKLGRALSHSQEALTLEQIGKKSWSPIADQFLKTPAWMLRRRVGGRGVNMEMERDGRSTKSIHFIQRIF